MALCRVVERRHVHTLVFDGVFFGDGGTGALDFNPLPPTTDEEVGVVLARIAARVRRLRRRGLDPGDADAFRADPVIEESPALAGISGASIQGRIALGSRAGLTVGLDELAPGLSLEDAMARLAGARIGCAVEQPELVVYEAPLLTEIPERQRLALISDAGARTAAAPIIDIDNPRNPTRVIETLEGVRSAVLERYGQPSQVFDRGGCRGPSLETSPTGRSSASPSGRARGDRPAGDPAESRRPGPRQGALRATLPTAGRHPLGNRAGPVAQYCSGCPLAATWKPRAFAGWVALAFRKLWTTFGDSWKASPAL
jgi:hypothetical protein